MPRLPPSVHDALPYIAIVCAGVVLAVLLALYDAFEALYAITRAYEAWELDELVIATFCTLLALVGALAVRLHRECDYRRLEQARLYSLVRRDVVTGLPNQYQLDDDLLQRMGAAGRDQAPFALILVDVRGLERICDVHGQSSTDKLVKRLAERLLVATEEEAGCDRLARLRDGSFALIVDTQDDLNAAITMVDRVTATVVDLETRHHFASGLSVNYGVAVFPQDGLTPDALIRCASMAAHRACATGKNFAVFYDPLLDEQQRQRAALAIDIRTALETGQFEPFFQPIVCLRSGRLVGFEALARWIHPERGQINPGEFIAIAEEAGMISDLFDVILKKACATARSWPPDVWVSVNVSPVQLSDERFVDKLLASLQACAFPADALVLEITENAIVRDMSAADAAMRRLRSHGVRFALDDFGTGYSSLTYLSRLPFNTVKIDKSFVADCHRVHSGHVIVASIISLCASLGLKTVGEGVETMDEAAALQQLGCTYAQGYWFFKPVPAPVATELIAMWKDRPARGARDADGGWLFEV